MTLFRYIFIQFLMTFLRVAGIFIAILFVIGVVDELGSLGENDGVTRAIYLSVIGQIETVYTIMPLMIIIAAITLFMGMSRKSELVVVRAAGISGLRFLIAPSLCALLIGIFNITALNPMVTSMATQFAIEKGRPIASTALNVSSVGLWLRQGDATAQMMINAKSSDENGLNLQGVSFIAFGADGSPAHRIEAKVAQLTPDGWALSSGYQWDLTAANPQVTRAQLPEGYVVPSDLSPEDLTSGFGKPSAVPIWSLPSYIHALEKAGFSARAYRVWLQSELAKPLSFVVMVLVAAGFTMRHIRAGNRVQMVLFAVLTGFGIFFLRNIAQVFGQNGQIPVILAAWGPTLAASLLALSLLLHMEDG